MSEEVNVLPLALERKMNEILGGFVGYWLSENPTMSPVDVIEQVVNGVVNEGLNVNEDKSEFMRFHSDLTESGHTIWISRPYSRNIIFGEDIPQEEVERILSVGGFNLGGEGWTLGIDSMYEGSPVTSVISENLTFEVAVLACMTLFMENSTPAELEAKAEAMFEEHAELQDEMERMKSFLEDENE